jgi:poly(A) polymerase
MEQFNLTFPEDKKYGDAVGLVQTLQQAGHTAYLVGGCVRDALLGLPVKDYDVASDAPPARIKELFPAAIPVGESFGVMILPVDGVPYEVATFREESGYADRRHPSNVRFSTADKDVRRRDFTMNGLFFDPIAGVGIDYVGGRADLEAKALRTIGDPRERFDEDALRLLRAARFSARFNLKIVPETREQIVALAGSLTEISRERIGEELTKGLLGPGPGDYIAMLSELKLLAVVLPEVSALTELRVVGESAFAMICQRLNTLAELLDDAKSIPLIRSLRDLEKRDGPKLQASDLPTYALWAGLCFEIGRPQATKKLDQGLWLGERMMLPAEEMWRDIVVRLAFSNQHRNRVTRPLHEAQEWQQFENLARWRQRELLAGDDAETSILLFEAFAATYSTSRAPLKAAKGIVNGLAKSGEPLLPPPLLNGNDLMKELRVKPGSQLGTVLERLRKEQLNGRIGSRDEALEFSLRCFEEFAAN